jgi:hypothetical protein
VLVTISDKKIAVASTTDPNLIAYYNADVVTANDYYPGGMTMPGRKYQQGSAKYRYSINGQEKESELNENITTAEYWEYDSRIGRRWNVDPVLKVGESPYLTFGGNPVMYSDPNGADAKDWIKKKIAGGKTQYTWDDKAVSPETTPTGSTYVGKVYRYAANSYTNVNLWGNGTWSAESASFSSGGKGTPPPAQNAEDTRPASPIVFGQSNIDRQHASFSPQGYTFNNDFERGMVKDNIATQASVMLVAPQTVVAKLLINTGAQVGVNGKNADVADIAINSFSPYTYGNQWATAIVDWKPMSGNLQPKVFPFTKSAKSTALDLGINHVFYGVGEFQKKVVSGQISENIKLAMGGINTTNKAIVKKAFTEGFFPAPTMSTNVSESTKAPPLYSPGLLNH